MDALSISYNRIKFEPCLFFLLLEEGNAALTHLLPAGIESDCFLVSASAMGCWLVVAFFSSSLRQNSFSLCGCAGFLGAKAATEGGCFLGLQRFLTPISVWHRRFLSQEYMERLDCEYGAMLSLPWNSQEYQGTA